jgi:beta-xylosidase
VTVIAAPKLEDPCPFWDDDGQAYLVHSRFGAGPLILHRMAPDGKSVLDAGKTIVDDPANLPTLEGPKLLKRNGWYYIFAPYGGVDKGPQAVMRSRSIWGPYESRTVLAQGGSTVQAPHQGGYVETPNGEGWFVHFNSTGAYGRIVHLQPVRWVDDWPIMGELIAGSATTGQPVATHRAPQVGKNWPPVAIQDSDEFNVEKLGLQWEWNHNPLDANWSLAARRGFLRLRALPATDFLAARNTLTQILQGPGSVVTVRMEIEQMSDTQRAGVAMLQVQPNWIGVVQTAGVRRITWSSAGAQLAGPVVSGLAVLLRMNIVDETVRYAYSIDEGKTFVTLGDPAKLRFSWWKGARPALFSFYTGDAAGFPGNADFDWFHVAR